MSVTSDLIDAILKLEMPETDDDFTPELARRIIVGYREVLRLVKEEIDTYSAFQWLEDASIVSVTDAASNPGAVKNIRGFYVTGAKGLVFRTFFIGTYPEDSRQFVIEELG